jgi:hypothetical protein
VVGAVSQHGPGNARGLVGQRCRGHVRLAPPCQSGGPPTQAVVLVLGRAGHRPCTLDQRCP